jgi:hypothetical protein
MTVPIRHISFMIAALASALPGGAVGQTSWLAWDEMQVAEEVYLAVSAEGGRLSGALMDLELPGHRAAELFAPGFEAAGLGEPGQPAPHPDLPARLGVTTWSWPAGEAGLLDPALSAFAWLEAASVKPVRGEFLDPERRTWRAETRFSMRGRAIEGGVLAVSGEALVDWRRFDPSEGGAPAWRIVRWQSLGATAVRRDGPLLREALADLLPDPVALAHARRSRHEEHVEALLADPRTFERPIPSFDPVSHDRHPAVAVVDVDDDGWDDLYLLARWGPNRLYRNRGDGTFEEVAGRYGLDVADHCTAALFADLDNDGDPDLFLGRSLERSLLLMREGDRYVDRTDRLAEPAPMLVASLAAADVDGDGLLDLHVSTYARKSGLLDPTLAPDPQEERALWPDRHPVLADVGPANVLLRNLGGGRFERWGAGTRIFRHTYQGSFSDYDRDGDPDLYLANDYAPNNLLRNRGDGTFEDVTGTTGTADVGFGMGAAWSDVDGDGDFDLYVSNMFSKAGARVTGALDELDPRFAKMARGNTLFRNDGASFAVVSGREPPAAPVEETGWSWGGLFADLDSDGWPDLVVPNGYFTAPAAHELPVDI